MPVDIETIHHSDYLKVIVTGAYDLSEAIEKFSYILEVCRHAGLYKLLVDFRRLQRKDSATLKGLYASSVEKKYVEYLQSGGHELQFAYVAPVVMSYEIGMEVAERGKWPFKLFDDVEDALDWLDVKRT